MEARAMGGAQDGCIAQADARAVLVAMIAGTLAERNISQVQAARICRTDQPTLSKILRGRTESVSLDKLLRWLLALGHPIELRIGQCDPTSLVTLTVTEDGRNRAG